MSWIVIALAWGDGEGYAGRRIWSERFSTHAAADLAYKFLNRRDDIEVTIIEDTP